MKIPFIKKAPCRYHKSLQAYLDTGINRKMDKTLWEHILGSRPCPECRSFYDDYMKFQTLLGKALERNESRSCSRHIIKSGSHYIRNGLIAAAAVLVLGIGSFQGITYHTRVRYLEADIKIYVNDLLDSPLMEIQDYISPVPVGWFESNEYTLDF